MLADDIAFSLAIIGLFLFTLAWSTHIFAHIYGYKLKKRCQRKPVKSSCKYPGVSILKPLKGVDDNLRENLETLFTQDYPTFEILFCFQDTNDPAILFVRHMINEYPQVDVRLFYGKGVNLGPNAKISNLLQCYDYVKYDLLFISDSFSKVDKDTLASLVNEMDDKVGLVHQIPYVCDSFGFSNVLEKVYYGTYFFRTCLFANSILVRFNGQRCMSGCSYLLRKHVLDKKGGLKPFASYLEEDSFIARAFINEKWSIRMSSEIEMRNEQFHRTWQWRERVTRRSQVRLRFVSTHWLEPIFECFFIGLVASLTMIYYLQWYSLLLFLFHVVFWCLSDYMLISLVQNGPIPFSKFEYIMCWIYREFACYVIFLKAMRPRVRINKCEIYRVKWGGELELMNECKEMPPVKLLMFKRLNVDSLPTFYDYTSKI